MRRMYSRNSFGCGAFDRVCICRAGCAANPNADLHLDGLLCRRASRRRLRQFEVEPDRAGPVSYGTSGGIGGGQLGCNYQMQNFVIGAEGELWGSSLSGSTTKLLGGEGGGAFPSIPRATSAATSPCGRATPSIVSWCSARSAAAWATILSPRPIQSPISKSRRRLASARDTGSGDYSGLLLGSRRIRARRALERQGRIRLHQLRQQNIPM